MNPKGLRVIYLDNNATTRPAPEVIDAMRDYSLDHWGNPSSAHSLGLRAKAGVDRARREIADFVGVDPGMVTFTASATEANNTAILSAIRAAPDKPCIVAGATEHSAVIAMARAQASNGYELVLVPPRASGVIDLGALEKAIDHNTALVSVMMANNETGVLNPVVDVAAVCRKRNVRWHCDAVQAAGRVPIDFYALGADYLTISAHKMHGPKGAGALIAATDAPFTPMLLGGHQEKGRRGGTENVAAIVGFGVAAALAAREMDARKSVTAMLRDRLEQGILATVPAASVNGSGPRLPNTTNIGFPGIDSDTLVSVLDQHGICVSSGSACLSDAVAPSHVVLAMTGSYQKASEAIRFSVSHLNTVDEIDRTIEVVKAAVLAAIAT